MKNGTLKIGDLGVSKIIKMCLAHTQIDTPYYCASEILREKPYNDKCDIIGFIIYEIYSLKFPFKGNSIENLYYNISNGKYSPIPYIYSEELGKLIFMMIVVYVRKRENIDDLINFPFDKKRIKGFFKDGKKAFLIRIIKMLKNIRDINEKLTKGSYEEKDIMEHI